MKWLRFLPLLAFGMLRPDADASTIMTVRGPIDATDLGPALTHEHVLVDFIGAEETGYHRWDRAEVCAVLQPHLEEVKELGFQSLFECTPAYIGRDPRLLQMLAHAHDLHLITNTGYYGARANQFIPEEVQAWSIDQLAAQWIAEFTHGIEDTGVKPGFIKIGVDRDPQLSPLHEKLVRAACRAHLQTGLTIACHTGPSPVIFQMAEIVGEEGVSPEAFIWVHATRDTPENLIKAAELGLWVSLDNVTDSPKRIDQITTSLLALKEAGLLNHILLSHDAGWYRPGEPDGGQFRPYTAISQELLPRLREDGFKEAEIDQLLVNNPQRAFSIRVRAHK